MTSTIPTDVIGLDAPWLTRVLQSDFPGITVTRAEIDEQTTGSAARVRIRIDAQGHPAAPDSVLVKAAFTSGLGDDDLARAWIPLMAMMHETESAWYTTQSASLGDRCPRCHHADVAGHDAVIVLEDLNNREGIRFGAFDSPLGAGDMAAVLEVLARIHAIRWDDPVLAAHPLRDSFEAGGMLDGFLSEVNWEQQLSRPRGEHIPEELTDHHTTTAAIRSAWAAKRTGPQSMIHGDPHVGNHFFDTTGAGLLDFQLVTSGHWASDVVYAMASSMTIDDRRTHERDLLTGYLDRLQSHTGAAPTFDDAWRDYRKFAIWGLASVLTPGDGVQSEEYLSVVSRRHAQAALDLGSIDLLATI
ncbi:phosphotransferase [Gordonia sp. NPDC003376]